MHQSSKSSRPKEKIALILNPLARENGTKTLSYEIKPFVQQLMQCLANEGIMAVTTCTHTVSFTLIVQTGTVQNMCIWNNVMGSLNRRAAQKAGIHSKIVEVASDPTQKADIGYLSKMQLFEKQTVPYWREGRVWEIHAWEIVISFMAVITKAT